MSSRFPAPNSQRQRLFATYNDSRSQSSTPPQFDGSAHPPSSGAYTSYPSTTASGAGGFRAATPNAKGQYSDSVLSELESQNDEEISGIIGKVKQLKSLTAALGEEIRDSTALAGSMNDTFENTSRRLKSTMNRMLIMAEKTGISWKVWLSFFMVVILLFWYVWLF